jgi:DNA-binding beta-propeller fold protein YncE
MLYDSTRNRLYVSNPLANTVTYLQASTDALTATVLAIANPISVAVLPDGTRAYISSAAFSTSGGVTYVTSRITVINASSGSTTTTIPLSTVKAQPGCGPNPSELSMAAAADSSRVYVGNCDAGNVAIIQTLSDTMLLQMPAPESAAFKPDGTPLPQNPVFVVAGP